jgi:ATP-dependent Lon protease
LPIGGLKEKLLAAHRGGIKTVVVPEENRGDLKEIPQKIKQDLNIIPVRWIDEVLRIALVKMPEPLSETIQAPSRITAEKKRKGNHKSSQTHH